MAGYVCVCLYLVSAIIVALLCTFMVSQQVYAVVNSGSIPTVKVEEIKPSQSTTDDKPKTEALVANDNIADSTDDKANRREAPLSLGDTYGAPLAIGPTDTYLPSGPSNVNLPVPIYGVPDGPSTNIVYPAPPPDIPPPSLPTLPSGSYGPPQPQISYGVPHHDISNSYGLPPIRYGVPSSKPLFFPAPSRGFKGPKPLYGPPIRQYGPPKPLFVPKYNKFPPKGHFNSRPSKPLNTYGPPQVVSIPFKDNYSPSKLNYNLNSNFLSSSVSSFGHSNHGINFGQSQHISQQYGTPDSSLLSGPAHHYGPPEPVAHPKPPHPGAPAPPTPPDIKYDGWQPIPGLVSKVPQDSYGVPPSDHHAVGDLSFNNDLSPPPLGHGGISLQGAHSHSHSLAHSSSSHGTAQFSLNNNHGPPHGGISDSYGAPLNIVTGSGGVVVSSGDAHQESHSGALSLGLSAAGIGHDSSIQAVKSIGYELFPNGGGNLNHGGLDSYSAPPLSSYSADGPYAASHSYKSNGFSSNFGASSHSHTSGHKGLSFSSAGLIPPSGLYGIPPSGEYGTPLFHGPSSHLNALKINPPKRPVVLREPVPAGLIDSIGKHTAHKEAFGFDLHSNGPTYLPPPVSDLPRPVKEEVPPEPSGLYNLPSEHSAVSFQNVVHGSSIGGLSNHINYNSGGGLNIEGATAQALTSYNAPLGIVDGSYSLPSQTGGLSIGLDHSLPPVSIDLTGSYAHSNNYAIPHDCSLHKSQQLPPLSYGVPLANSYTASLSSLTTNIGGIHASSNGYTGGDLHASHSQNIATKARANFNEIAESEGKIYGKSVSQNFGPNSELIESQSLDLKNIPVQGNLGSYTLQIQSADGAGGIGQVPHSQVLHDGLLQSILSAIEQPQKNGAGIGQPIIGQPILGQPILQLQPTIQQYLTNETQLAPSVDIVPDTIPQGSNPSEYTVLPVTEATDANVEKESEKQDVDADSSLRLIDDNEIALYFSNNQQRHKKDTKDGEGTVGEDAKKVDEIKNSH